MLIRYFVENFLSFNDQVEFSMIPGRGRLLSHHIVRGEKRSDINILRSSVIYGANASGKSNLIKSMNFARGLIVYGVKPAEAISLKKFRLDLKSVNKPSKFQFDFKYKGKHYSYGFTLDSNRIYEEWLYEINKFSEKLLFERKTTNDSEISIKFGKILSLKKTDLQFLMFVAKGTRPNQLFLTESIQRNVKLFSDVYEWFDDVLSIIFPDTKYDGIEFFFARAEKIKDVLLEFLHYFDTGISNIVCEKYLFEKDLKEIPEDVIEKVKKDLNKPKSIVILSSPQDERYLVYKDVLGDFRALRLTSRHRIKDSKKEAIFEINEESDGTQRIVDFLPFLISLLSTNSVLVVDEIDRSLHPLLVKKFLEIFLKLSSKANGQLIVTTHDPTLLNLKLLRKDEIWFVEKNNESESKLYSLEDFKPRYDKDIQKGYLLGRFGAIPFFRDVKELGWP